MLAGFGDVSASMLQDDLDAIKSIKSFCSLVGGRKGNKFGKPVNFSKIDAGDNMMFWVPAGYISARRVQDADERLSK